MGKAKVFIAEQLVGVADEAVILEAMRHMRGSFAVTRVAEQAFEFRADFRAMSSPGGEFLLDHLAPSDAASER